MKNATFEFNLFEKGLSDLEIEIENIQKKWIII